MSEKYKQLFNSLTDRRTFLKLVSLLGASAAIPTLSSCGVTGIRGDLAGPASGFNPYNGRNPNLKHYHHERQTWLDNVIEHKVDWAGIQYVTSYKEPIVAPADGIIASAQINRKGYHGLEDKVVMNHGGGIQTVYIHLSPHGSGRLVDYLSTDKIVRRGEEIGRGGEFFKIYMFRENLIGDMDHYGPNMGYMDYWDGKTKLDFPFDEVGKRNDKQISLMYDLILKYQGPGAAQLQDVCGSIKIPKMLVHKLGRDNLWEHAMVIKLLQYMYDNNPGDFDGTRQENDNLIAEIYQKQPVILTLPFKLH